MDLRLIIDAYWEHYRRLPAATSAIPADAASEQAFFWAWEAVETSMTSDEIATGQHGVGRIQLLIALADTAPDQQALAYLGAGPIENLLRYHQPNIDLVDEAARRHESFRIALRCAWFDAHIPVEDAKRLRRFGPPL